MKSKIIAVSAGLMLLFSLGACKKKEEAPPPVPPHGTQPTDVAPTVMMPKGETKIVVPETVKGKWDAVKLEIVDKTTSKKETVTVKLNSEYKIPNSNLKIKVGEFLPDFRMDGLTITSASNEPKNPAVRVIVYEGDKEIFKGWLYSKFPTIHPFQHDKYALTLVEGIKASGKS